MNIEVPKLDIDDVLGVPSSIGKLERRIVAAFIYRMHTLGWKPDEVVDSDQERTAVTDAKSVMEEVFNLDDAFVTFTNGKQTYWVRLILGNGVDIISDYSFRQGDPDGFDAAISGFNAEEFE